MKQLIICFLLAFLHVSAFAQNYVDLLAAGATYSPRNIEKGTGNKVDITETFVNLRVPVLLQNKDVGLAGIGPNSMSFHRYYEPVYPDMLYGATMLLGYTKKWNDRFQTMLLALPRIASDFKDLSSKDLQLGGILLFGFKKSETFK